MTRLAEELLWTDRDGDQLYTGPQSHDTTLLFIRPGEGEVWVPTAAVDALRAALKAGSEQ